MDAEAWGRLKARTYFSTATFDDRYVWEEITPTPETNDVAEVIFTEHPQTRERTYMWADGLPRYRMVGCAHKHRENGRCPLCGDEE